MRFSLGSFPIDSVVTGQIIKLEPSGVLVDFGTGEPAYVRRSDLSLAEIKTSEEAVRLNDAREFLVVGNYDREHTCFLPDCTPETLNESNQLEEIACFQASLVRERPVSKDELILHTKILDVHPNGMWVKIQLFLHSFYPPTLSFSIRRLELKTAWERMRQLQAEDVTLYPKVEPTKPYASVKVEWLRGFIDNIDRRREELIIGEEVPVKILEAKEEFDRLRFIRPCALAKLRQLRSGQTVDGTVRGVKPYGLFIDINGLTALLHISKMTLTADELTQHFKANDAVKATIAEINLERARIYLESCEKLG